MTTLLTKFKRIEQKYILTLEQKAELLQLLQNEIIPDEYGKNNGNYQLESCYYDTDDLLFYHEKIGKKEIRKKIRIRRYVDENAIFDENSPVFVEIKEKIGEITQKRRVKMSYREAKDFLEKQILPKYQEKHAEIIAEIAELAALGLKPQTLTKYDRQAFFGKNSDTGLRLTFDTAVEYRASDTTFGKTSLSDGKIIDTGVTILEMKALGNFPQHILDFFQKNGIQPARMSKYAKSVESSQKFISLV